jgi:DNA-binding transcriptional regulator GbsR (MarR family)
MEDNCRIQKQKELIEEIGRFFDRDGFSPIEGRIMGLLMISDKEQFTFDEIIEELKISKSSASNAIRNLELRGGIEYVTLPGNRKRFFRIKTQSRFARLEEMEKKVKQFAEINARILELKKDKSSRSAQYIIDVQEMMEVHLNYLMKLKEQFKVE